MCCTLTYNTSSQSLLLVSCIQACSIARGVPSGSSSSTPGQRQQQLEDSASHFFRQGQAGVRTRNMPLVCVGTLLCCIPLLCPHKVLPMGSS